MTSANEQIIRAALEDIRFQIISHELIEGLAQDVADATGRACTCRTSGNTVSVELDDYDTMTLRYQSQETQ